MTDHPLAVPSMLASSVLIAWNALTANGFDADAVFVEAGMDPARLADSNARYAATSITRLHEVIMRVTGNPTFMLKLAEFWHPSHLHALGYGWLASTSLKDAFQRLVRYYDIVAIKAERVAFEQTAKGYVFKAVLPADFHPVHESEGDSILSVLLAMCRISRGDGFTPILVRLSRPEPEPTCLVDYHRFFRTKVEFGCNEWSLLLSASDVEAELPTGNTTLARACDRIIDTYLAALDQNHVINQVRLKIVESMPSGRVHEDDIAKLMEIGTGELQHKLKSKGTTFKSVLDETRKELALSYVKDRHTTVNEMTYLLGYSDPANFSRAYRRWTGASPTADRARVAV